MTTKLPFRQIHLDFHTSPLIPNIAAEFDADEFVRMLKLGHVDSVTCFAKCHHGMSYYDTSIGVRHPHLKFDLLKAQIEACHRAGIAVPIYYSIVWDNYVGEKHPEWRQIKKDGKLAGAGPLDAGCTEAGWKYLCMNTPYVDLVQAQTEEILDNYDVDGFFFDIVFQINPGCYCEYCMKSMRERGLNPENDADAKKMSEIIIKNFCSRISSAVRAKNKDARIFHNGTVNMNLPGTEKQMSHIEIEALPSGGWGYAYYPFWSRYARQYNPATLGMTGRFSKSWADFGGLKTVHALEFDCSAMLANGSKCSIGDQMHPKGKLDLAVYETIGEVYSKVEQAVPWCCDVKAVTQIGLLVLSGPNGYKTGGDDGAAKMLLEMHQQFDVLDASMDLSKYELVLVADQGEATPEIKAKILEYLKNGGKLIFSHQALLSDKEEFSVELGVKYLGAAELVPDFFRPGPLVSRGIREFDYVMYEQTSRVEPLAGTEILADAYESYFNRTWEHFTSHGYSPVAKKADYPAVVRNGNAIYIYGPVFGAYQTHQNVVFRKLVENCIDLLLPERLVCTSAPPSTEVTLMQQNDRHIIHIVNYSPNRRSGTVEVIEEPISLHDVKIEVTLPKPVSRVYLAPSQTEIPFSTSGNKVSLVVPKVETHEMVALE